MPFDDLYTNEVAPQILIDINGMPALCTTLDCGYTYETPTAELTTMTVTDDSTVEIQGTALPTELTAVVIGSTPCTITSNDETTI